MLKEILTSVGYFELPNTETVEINQNEKPWLGWLICGGIIVLEIGVLAFDVAWNLLGQEAGAIQIEFLR